MLLLLLVLLWVVHHVLRLLSGAGLLLVMVGVKMGSSAIGIEGRWIPRAISI